MNRRDFIRGVLTYTAATALGSMAAQLAGPKKWAWPRPPGHVVIGFDHGAGPDVAPTVLYQNDNGTWMVCDDQRATRGRLVVAGQRAYPEWIR